MRIGIDFGTTNSSVACFDGRELRPIILDPDNENPHVLPSLIYIDREQNFRLGSAAATEYLARETGRRAVWEERRVGDIEIVMAEMRYMQFVHIVTDTGANGRLLQSVKTALRDPGYEATDIFGQYYTVDQLIALILRALKQRAEAQLGQPCESAVIGRPVRFSDDPAVTVRAEEIIYRAARFAGFREVAFEMEPIGALHLYHRAAPRRRTALVFDFGGGTLDLTVAEVGGSQPPRVIATRGVLVGGDDLDRRIMCSLLKYFGEGTKVEGGRPFPPDFLDMLHAWQTMPYLSRPSLLYKIRQFQKSSDNPRAMEALETLVSRNVGYRLFREIEAAKKALSNEWLTRLDFVYEKIAIHERILRRAFEEMIAAEVQMVEAEIPALLAEAGLRAEEVDVVLRTGGTSLVPAFTALLERAFGHEKMYAMDALTSVVGGMAVIAHEGGGAPPAYAERYINPIRAVQTTSGNPYRPYIFHARAKCYSDRGYTISKLPLALSGLCAVQTPGADAGSAAQSLVRFTLDRPTKVYVIYSNLVAQPPRWLKAFTREEGLRVEVETDGGRMPFLVCSKEFPAGPLTLGGMHAAGYHGQAFLNYLVVVEPK